jgi:hypothetical protein
VRHDERAAQPAAPAGADRRQRRDRHRPRLGLALALRRGPDRAVVANLTDASQQITLETAGRSSRPGLRRQTTPIDPRDTATLKADVRSGRYVVHVAGDGIDAATLRVSGRRRSAQNDLLQP